MRNPFRQPQMRKAFAEMVEAYEQRKSVLFLPNGNRNRGNSPACMFWNAVDGHHIGTWDHASKQMFAYAYWKAGQAVRAAEEK